ncbi:hypothetical protein EXIGLDRAFT_196633 [Exidia glandulosa HHB12029]|uniref:Uncharacterized protein n=1 Tax=Exidia glandulosa HHB12029 TaxID=1314781 RepID=A0A165ET97_EXIGL|nr:hypothetical protein EXIGLDRAFT_196633 [Exidia glandulosa HHB12029]
MHRTERRWLAVHPGAFQLWLLPSPSVQHSALLVAMADADHPELSPKPNDASATVQSAALTPKSRKKGLQIKKSPASTPKQNQAPISPIDSVTPSFTRNLHKLISSNRRHKLEVVSLRTQVEKLQEENLVLDREASGLRSRVSSLELEHTDLRSLSRENERAPSPTPEARHTRRALAPLNAHVGDHHYGDQHPAPDSRALPCSGASGPSAQALASPSKVHTKRAGFSLPTRAAASPYRMPAPTPAGSYSTHTSPRSQFSAELPALTPHTSSPSSINTPLPTPSTSDFIQPLDKSTTSSSTTRKRLSVSALFGIPSAKKNRAALDRENDEMTPVTVVRSGSTRSAKVMMVTSISPDTSAASAAAAVASAYSKDASPGESSYATRGPSPYSAMSHSTTSSQRKVTPKSTMSRSTAGRVAFELAPFAHVRAVAGAEDQHRDYWRTHQHRHGYYGRAVGTC